MIGEEELAQLEDGYVINCARGGIIDEPALAAAVEDGIPQGRRHRRVRRGALSEDSPLLDVDDVIVTPHLGASTEAAQVGVATSTADQIIAAFDDEPVVNALNALRRRVRLRPHPALHRPHGETAGKVAVRLFDGRVGIVDVTYAGDIAEEDVELVTASALKGVLEPLVGSVNGVNAQGIAENRGIEVTETKTNQNEDFQSLITVEVGDGEDSVSVSGTQFAGDDERIVRIDGYRVDAIPTATCSSPATKTPRASSASSAPCSARPASTSRDVQRPRHHRRRGPSPCTTWTRNPPTTCSPGSTTTSASSRRNTSRSTARKRVDKR